MRIMIMEFKDGTKIETHEGGSIYDTAVKFDSKTEVLELKTLLTDDNVEKVKFYRGETETGSFENLKLAGPLTVALEGDNFIAHIHLMEMDPAEVQIRHLKEMTEIQNQAIMELAEMLGEQDG